MSMTLPYDDTRKLLENEGIGMLTGEACAFGLRILCDVTEQGIQLVERAFGIVIDRQRSPRNMNSKVGSEQAVLSMMFSHKELDDLLKYAIIEERTLQGELVVFATPKEGWARPIVWAGTRDEYLEEWKGEHEDEEGNIVPIENPIDDTHELRQRLYDWRVYSIYSEQPHVGGRNVHAMSGRYK